MNVLQVFAVKDRQVGLFMTPFFMQSKGQAIRSFSDECNRAAEDNVLYKHTDDFELFHLGEFECASALFRLSGAELVVTGAAVRVSAEVRRVS